MSTTPDMSKVERQELRALLKRVKATTRETLQMQRAEAKAELKILTDFGREIRSHSRALNRLTRARTKALKKLKTATAKALKPLDKEEQLLRRRIQILEQRLAP
jgi:uncharacterized membrane protein